MGISGSIYRVGQFVDETIVGVVTVGRPVFEARRVRYYVSDVILFESTTYQVRVRS